VAAPIALRFASLRKFEVRKPEFIRQFALQRSADGLKELSTFNNRYLVSRAWLLGTRRLGDDDVHLVDLDWF
jgi:hypothetical protein